VPDGMDVQPVRDYVVVCVDMWASSAAWLDEGVSSERLGEAVIRHNSQVDEIFGGHRSEGSEASSLLGDGRLFFFVEEQQQTALEFAAHLLTAFPTRDAEFGLIETSIAIAFGPVVFGLDELAESKGISGRPVDWAARLSTVAGCGAALVDYSAIHLLHRVCGKFLGSTWDWESNQFTVQDHYMVKLPGAGSSTDWPLRQVAVMTGVNEPTHQFGNGLAWAEQFADLHETLTGTPKKRWNDDLDRLEKLISDEIRRPEDAIGDLPTAFMTLLGRSSLVVHFLEHFPDADQYKYLHGRRAPEVYDEMLREPEVVRLIVEPVRNEYNGAMRALTDYFVTFGDGGERWQLGAKWFDGDIAERVQVLNQAQAHLRKMRTHWSQWKNVSRWYGRPRPGSTLFAGKMPVDENGLLRIIGAS
jgi:class 3 adenylate cyclase